VTSAQARLGLPHLGDGVGLREAHYSYLLGTAPEQWGVDWFEIITENFLDEHGLSAHVLERVLDYRPVVMHGVSLSIGSADPLDRDYLRKVRLLADKVRPAWVSDHLCWTGVNGRMSHDLLPMPLNRASLAHVADRVRAVQDDLGRPLVLENPSTYMEFYASDIPEWEFLGTLAEETGCGLLLDVNNVFVASYNHSFDPAAYINALPARHIVQVHLAGPRRYGTHLLDSHDQPVPDEVWPLYALAQQRTGGVPTLLEWDAEIPPFPDLVAELAKAKTSRATTAAPSNFSPAPAPTGGAATVGLSGDDGQPIEPGHLVPWDVSGGGRLAVGRKGSTELAELQRWVLASISPAAEIRRPLVQPARLIKKAEKRSAEFSLQIYSRGYVARLAQCLEREYPVLRTFVGDQVFGLFTRAYISERPPRSPSLTDFGAGFADFLEETRPAPLGPPNPLDAIPAAIAHLERASAESLHADGVEDDPHFGEVGAVDLIDPSELRLRAPATLHLLRAEFSLADAFAACQRGEVPGVPLGRPTRYAVARNYYRVSVHEITEWQYAFLDACSGATVPWGQVLAHVSAATGLQADGLWAGLLAWLPGAVSAGMVAVTGLRQGRGPAPRPRVPARA